jgi:PAS domain S-box-containing protein
VSGAGPDCKLRAHLEAVMRALEPTGDALLAFDRGGRCVHSNASAEALTGLSTDRLLGRTAFDILPALAPSGEGQHLEAALSGQSSVSRDRPFYVPESGREGFFDAYYSPLILDGEVVGGLALFRDITQTKRIVAQMADSGSRFRNMADASPVLLWMARPDAMCTFFNQTWLDFTGRTLQEEWGVGWAEGVHYEDFQSCVDTYLAAFSQRRSFEMEYRLRRADGEYRWILDRGTPRYAPDGSFVGYIGSCVDITDRKHLENELRRALRAQDEFLSIAAHELRTPLTPLLLGVEGLLQQARRQDSAEPVALRRLEMLRDNVRRQARLIDHLLDVSRMTAGPVQLQIERVEVASVVDEVVRQFSDEARRSSTELRVRSEPGSELLDRLRFEQILRNLISNALKYGEGRPVDVELGFDEEMLRLRVRDRGIGISSADQARVFERFQRAVSARTFGGFGLGLWITRKLVNAMDGTIAVESRLGEGATFVVELRRRSAIVGNAPLAG